MITRRAFLACQAGMLAGSAIGLKRANAQPLSQLSRVVVGFTAGGAADTIARLMIDQMREQAPRVIIDNKAGAGGRLALDLIKNTPPDGSAVILTPASMIVLYPHVYKKLSYDPLKDFTPISTVCTAPLAIVVGPRVGPDVRSIVDFVTWCKANPNQASFGTPGSGSMLHFIGDMLWRAAGIQPTHIPYRGGSPMIQDVIGGQIPAAITVLSSTLPQVSAGTLRVLAITGAQRSHFLPDVPTLQELGFKDAIAEEWYGVLAPAGLPAPVIANLNGLIRTALKSEKLLASFGKFGFTAIGENPDEFMTLIKTDTERWHQIVKASNYVPED